MIKFDYLFKGVCGLANAHRAGTMAGHLGAAVAAGYFFGEDQADLPKQVFVGIERELDRIIAGEEAIWFNAQKAGVTPTELFRELPVAEANDEAIDTIAKALLKNVSKTRQSGHNIIFASIAIRALRGHRMYASPQIVSGICKLINGFDNAHPGRGYFGETVGWKNGNEIKLVTDDAFPLYGSVQEMIDVTITELIDTADKRRQGFGGLWHLINHAAAIAELDRFGYRDVVKNALPAHHSHMRLWRQLPDVEGELGKVKKAAHDPREAAYWDDMLKRDEARLTHRVKTLYGFYTIKRHVTDRAKLTSAEDAFLYLMD